MRHTRVASTPRGIFLGIISMRIFLSNFFPNFFFPNFFSESFFKIYSGFVSRVSHARHTRVSSTLRGIFLVIISMRIFLSNFFSKFFFQIFLKIHIITRKIPRGVLATRVCLACETLETNAEKIWKKNLTKKL